MRSSCVLIVLAIALLFVPFAHAQTGVYLEFSATNPDNWIYGGTAGVYHDAWHLPFVKAGVDVRGSFLGNGQTPNTPQIYGVTGGPRLSVHLPVVPIRPYVEALAGAGHVRIGSANTGNFEYQLVGGIDLTVFPRLDWRVFDFAYTAYPGLNVGYRTYYLGPTYNDSFSPKMLSTGLVLRLP